MVDKRTAHENVVMICSSLSFAHNIPNNTNKTLFSHINNLVPRAFPLKNGKSPGDEVNILKLNTIVLQISKKKKKRSLRQGKVNVLKSDSESGSS